MDSRYGAVPLHAIGAKGKISQREKPTKRLHYEVRRFISALC